MQDIFNISRKATTVGKKDTLRFAGGQPAAAGVAVQVIDSVICHKNPSDDTCDVVFTFMFTSGSEANGNSNALLPGPFSASLSCTTTDATLSTQWDAVLDALKAGSRAFVVTDIGLPAQPLSDVTFADGTVTFPNIPTPLPTSTVCTPTAVVQHLYVLIVGVKKAPLTAYFQLDSLVEGTVKSIASFTLNFAPSGSDPLQSQHPTLQDHLHFQVVWSSTPGAMPIISSDMTTQDVVACPAYAPSRHGVCELNASAIVPLPGSSWGECGSGRLSEDAVWILVICFIVVGVLISYRQWAAAPV